MFAFYLFFQSRLQGIVCKVQSLQFKEHDNEIKQRIRRQSQHAKVIAYTTQKTYRSKNGRNMIAKKFKYSLLFMSFTFFVKLEGVKGFNEWECFSIRVNRSYCRNLWCTIFINMWFFLIQCIRGLWKRIKFHGIPFPTFFK